MAGVGRGSSASGCIAVLFRQGRRASPINELEQYSALSTEAALIGHEVCEAGLLSSGCLHEGLLTAVGYGLL